MRFLIQAVYDTLPSPVNLHTWGKAETPQCSLCEKRGSLKHILSSCTRALGDGRYRWRHDQVLGEIAGVFDKCLRTSIYKPVSRRINFVMAGGNVRSALSEKHRLLVQPLNGSYLLIWMSSRNSLIILFGYNLA